MCVCKGTRIPTSGKRRTATDGGVATPDRGKSASCATGSNAATTATTMSRNGIAVSSQRFPSRIKSHNNALRAVVTPPSHSGSASYDLFVFRSRSIIFGRETRVVVYIVLF